VSRALKILVGSLLALGLLPVAFVYGLYCLGTSRIADDWGPTTVQFPDAARSALLRSYGGQGLPAENPISPLGYAWRFATTDMRLKNDPGMTLAWQLASLAPLAPGERGANHHLMRIAALIRASHWPVASQLDTVLASAYFGGETHGLRDGALRLYGRPLESLDDAQLHVLIAMMPGPGYYDPWCHRDRLRTRALETAAKWRVAATQAQLEAALASIGPPPLDSRCAVAGAGTSQLVAPAQAGAHMTR
jgi:hypothetical protein